jgi:hypothetical protein
MRWRVGGGSQSVKAHGEALTAPVQVSRSSGSGTCWSDDVDPIGRLQLELLSSEILCFRDSAAFLAAVRLSCTPWPTGSTRTANGVVRRGPGPCLARRPGCGPAGPAHSAAGPCGGVVRLAAGHHVKGGRLRRAGRAAHAQLRADPAIAAAGAAAHVAGRLGLIETQTNARITVAAR